jgi:hypothetical protein
MRRLLLGLWFVGGCATTEHAVGPVPPGMLESRYAALQYFASLNLNCPKEKLAYSQFGNGRHLFKGCGDQIEMLVLDGLDAEAHALGASKKGVFGRAGESLQQGSRLPDRIDHRRANRCQHASRRWMRPADHVRPRHAEMDRKCSGQSVDRVIQPVTPRASAGLRFESNSEPPGSSPARRRPPADSRAGCGEGPQADSPRMRTRSASESLATTSSRSRPRPMATSPEAARPCLRRETRLEPLPASVGNSPRPSGAATTARRGPVMAPRQSPLREGLRRRADA